MKVLLGFFVVLGLMGCEYETTSADLVPGTGGSSATLCEDSSTWTDTGGNPCSAFADLQEYCPEVTGAESNCPASCGLCDSPGFE